MENTVASMADLERKIKALEALETIQIATVKAQMSVVADGLKPAVLLKSAFSSIVKSKTVQRNVIDSTLGMGAGFIAKKLFMFRSKNIFRKMVGSALQFITTKVVTKKMPVIRGKIAEIKH